MTLLQPTLNWIIPILIQNKIPFHISGGLAAHLYGAKRPVNDIDIDMPNSFLDVLAPKVSEYIKFGPGRYQDTTWNLYLMTLNYHGQLIDLTGAEEAYFHNKTTKEWDPMVMNFDSVVWVKIFGIDIPVQNPQDLISYKLKIKYDEFKHLGDVEAVQQYLGTLNNKPES